MIRFQLVYLLCFPLCSSAVVSQSSGSGSATFSGREKHQNFTDKHVCVRFREHDDVSVHGLCRSGSETVKEPRVDLQLQATDSRLDRPAPPEDAEIYRCIRFKEETSWVWTKTGVNESLLQEVTEIPQWMKHEEMVRRKDLFRTGSTDRRHGNAERIKKVLILKVSFKNQE